MKSLFLLNFLCLGLDCEDPGSNGISENLPVKEGGDVVLHCDLGKRVLIESDHGNVFRLQAPPQRGVSGGKIIG